MNKVADNSTTVHFRLSRDKSELPGRQPSSTTFSMISKRHIRVVFVFILMAAMGTVYVTLFQHPPPDKLLEMNKKGMKDFDFSVFGGNAGNDRDAGKRTRDENAFVDDDDDDTKSEKKAKAKDDSNEELDNENFMADDHMAAKKPPRKREAVPAVQGASRESRLKGKDTWDKFIQQNGFTAIGVVFDQCDKPREQLGTVIMMPDPEFGGVKSRTFYNFTLEEDLEGGTFKMEVRYNGQDLYDNWWELCEMEEDLEPQNRTFSCPIRKGRQSLVKDKHIPSYLPKGRYQSKAWVNDEEGKLLVCGFSDFVL